MAIGLFCLTILSSICQHQASRAALIDESISTNPLIRSQNRAITVLLPIDVYRRAVSCSPHLRDL
jgi:hypothetical protein